MGMDVCHRQVLAGALRNSLGKTTKIHEGKDYSGETFQRDFIPCEGTPAWAPRNVECETGARKLEDEKESWKTGNHQRRPGG